MTDADVEALRQRARRLRASGLTAEQTATAMLVNELQTFSLCFGVPLTRKTAQRLVRDELRKHPFPWVSP